MRLFVVVLLVVVALPAQASANGGVRVLTAEVEVKAPVEKVWKAWTTPEGLKTFFAPDSNVEPRIDGLYEILFWPAAKPGERGAEGQRILGLEPMSRFAFTWNAPPSIPDIREQRTVVVLEFKPVGAERTRVRFTQLGWGEGKSWDAAYEYFDRAWNTVVLPRFRHAMEVGPIEWQKEIPKLEPIMPTMKVSLAVRMARS
jgi:uncharacterized protein YndB with AHSA1/START domain